MSRAALTRSVGRGLQGMERERVEKHKKKMIDDEKKVERAAQVRLPLLRPR